MHNLLSSFIKADRLKPAGYALLVFFALAVFLPGFFTLPPMDRDESRFAQASKQMLETGDYIDIRFQDEARHKKPVGIYWLQAGSVKLWQALTGDTRTNIIWPYRIPSLVGATLSVLLTALIGARLFSAEAGFMAGIFMAVSLLLNVEARLAKTDAVLLATILACQLVMAKAFCRAGYARVLKTRDVLLFWVAFGIGVLIKGPLLPLVVFGTLLMLAFWKQPLGWFKHLRPFGGGLLALLIIAPWFYLITARTAGTFYNEAVGHDLLAKIWQGQNWGGAPPGVHAIIFWGVFWPGSLFVLLAAPWVWAQRKTPAIRFLLAWIIPVWLVFELTFTKLPHYVLPAYPALALLAAAWLHAADDKTLEVPGWLLTGISIIWLLVGFGFVLALALLPLFVEKDIFYAALFFGALALGAALACVLLVRVAKKRALAAVPLPLAGFALMVALFGFMLPNLNHVFMSSRIVDALPAPTVACPAWQVATAGYNEPSLVFLAGTRTQFLEKGDALGKALYQQPCLVAVVDSAEESAFKAAAPSAKFLTALEGFNHGRGKPVTLQVFAP